VIFAGFWKRFAFETQTLNDYFVSPFLKKLIFATDLNQSPQVLLDLSPVLPFIGIFKFRFGKERDQIQRLAALQSCALYYRTKLNISISRDMSTQFHEKYPSYCPTSEGVGGWEKRGGRKELGENFHF